MKSIELSMAVLETVLLSGNDKNRNIGVVRSVLRSWSGKADGEE